MKEEEAEVEGEEEIAETKEESTEMNIDLSDDVKALVSTDADFLKNLRIKLRLFLKLLLRQEYKNRLKILEITV